MAADQSGYRFPTGLHSAGRALGLGDGLKSRFTVNVKDDRVRGQFRECPGGLFNGNDIALKDLSLRANGTEAADVQGGVVGVGDDIAVPDGAVIKFTAVSVAVKTREGRVGSTREETILVKAGAILPLGE